jgi:putative transcriptional regulator
MAKHTPSTSRILDAVHETALDLQALGVIDRHKLREYEILCEKPISEYSSEEIRALRERYQLSQTVLAKVLNISLATVRQWERSDQRRRPSGPSLKLLNLLDRKGIEGLI